MSSLGRPRVLDEPKRQIVCAILATGGTLDGDARYIGCARSTIERERRRNPIFSQQLDEAEVDGATMPFQLFRDASRSSWRAAAWMLEQSYPERYGRSAIPPSKRASLKLRRELSERLSAKLRESFAKSKPAAPSAPPAQTPQQFEQTQ